MSGVDPEMPRLRAPYPLRFTLLVLAVAACGSPSTAPVASPSPSGTPTDAPASSAAPVASGAAASASSSAAAAPSAPQPAPTASAAAPPSPAAVIAVVPFKAKVDRDGHSFAIELAADGKVLLDGHPFARVDGDSVVSNFGNLRLTSDGGVIPSFESHVAKFTADDGLVDDGGTGIRLRDDGVLEMSEHGQTRKVPLKVEKMQPGKRRTALLVCVAVMGFIQARERQAEDNGSLGGPPPPPPPPPPPR